MNNKILLSVGLMVYNEKEHIKEAILSILKQKIEEIEIIVGDNASTDGSSEIISNLAENDNRIIHIKRKTNIGALENWNDLVTQARGKYFVLAGGHDLWSQNYLQQLVNTLDTNDRAVLSFAKTQWIDDMGQEIDVPTCVVDTSGKAGLSTFIMLMFSGQHYLYGVMRLDAVRKTRLQKKMIGSGEIFLQELIQFGDFVLTENERWYRRKNRSEDSFQRLNRYRDVLFSNEFEKFKFSYFPYTRFMFNYFILPFFLKELRLITRLSLIASYPLILVRSVSGIYLDFKWLISR